MKQPRIRVLLIEDDPGCVVLVQRRLKELSGVSADLVLERAAALKEGLDRLGKGDVDVLLLDLRLPDSQGVDTVVRVRERDGEVPIVVLTSNGDDETALRALRAGAQDYLVKTELTGSLLGRVIRHAIERQRERREREQLQERLLRAQKRESLGVMAGGMAWAIDRSLGRILESADAALAELAASSGPRQVESRLQAISQAALEAGKLTGRMRTYSRGGRRRREPVDLSAIVAEASDFIESMIPSAIDVSYELRRDLPAVEGDEVEIRQAVINLVVNAWEAVGEALGAIRVSTGSRWADREYLDASYSHGSPPEGEYVFFEVRDTGQAMSRETMARVFDPFFTTKYAGRGLGLAATFGVVRGHDGAIKVESSQPGGTAFTGLVPARS